MYYTTEDTLHFLTEQQDRFSYAGGRRSMCKSIGLKPSDSGCAKVLKSGGWDKGKRDDAIDLLCDAGLLSGVDCAYYQAGGEEPNGETGLTQVWVALFVLLALVLVAWFLVKKFKKKKQVQL